MPPLRPVLFFLGIAALAPSLGYAGSPADAVAPELPRLFVDTRLAQAHGRTIAVGSGGDFQAALDAAGPGDVITLEAGVVFTGPFTLPVKPGAEWIVVRSSAAADLPPPGRRIDPSHAPLMPKLEAASGAVITAAPGAHHYRFIGIEIRPGAPERSARRTLRSLAGQVIGRAAAAEAEPSRQTLVLLGSSETAVDQLAHHLVFDRCYIHGDARRGARRGVAMNSRHTAVVDSHLSDFKEVGADAQAILGWNGAGPFKIANNYLEGSGENVMFGGADPAIRDLVPSDIEIRGNHFAKPLAWKSDDPSYQGTPWTVKNLFELKNARRVLIDGNVFEFNWPQAQNGFAILFTVRNQDGGAPWSTVEDVTFTNNVVRHVANGVNILGHDDIQQSQPTRRILVGNNVFEDVGGRWGRGALFQLLNAASDVAIRHNTALQTDIMAFGGDGNPHERFVFSDNIAPHNEFGIIGSGTAAGNASLARYFPGATVRGNAIVGGFAGRYPPENFFPPSLDDVGFVDRAAGDYRLGRSSPLRRAVSDRADVGADFRALCSAIRRSVRPGGSFAFCPARGDHNGD